MVVGLKCFDKERKGVSGERERPSGDPDGLRIEPFRRLFYVFVQPAEELAVPDERVLGFEHLMGFVFELHQTGRDSADAGGGERFERLRVGDAEVVSHFPTNLCGELA